MNREISGPLSAGKDHLLSDDALASVSGGAAAMFSKVCPYCKKYSKFLILSSKKAVCKNCGERIDINQ